MLEYERNDVRAKKMEGDELNNNWHPLLLGVSALVNYFSPVMQRQKKIVRTNKQGLFMFGRVDIIIENK
jgi:hypothetical protein